jgi:hypothetical protein
LETPAERKVAVPRKENNDRCNPGIKGRRPDNKKHKREEAAERQAAYDGLTAAQKLAKLDRKLGEGVGAKRERAKLQSAVEPLQVSESK